MIELRPDIPGFYKGLVFCRGLDQANEVKNKVTSNSAKKIINSNLRPRLKEDAQNFHGFILNMV